MTGRCVAGIFLAWAAYATAGATGWEWVYPQPRGGDLHAVISTQDGFVAVGDGGTILHSSDGVDWQLVSIAAGADLQGVATDGAVIVAVGDSGTIVRGTLSDPTWRRASPTTYADLDDVAWGHGSWLAVGDTGTILTSTDGVAWQPLASSSTANLHAATWTGDRWYVVGERPAVDGSNYAIPTILSSVDGGEWQLAEPGDITCPEPAECEAVFLRDVARVGDWTVAAGGYWVTVFDFDADGGTVFVTTDGSSWDRAPQLSWPPAGPFVWPECNSFAEGYRAIAVAGGHLVMVGGNGSAAVAPIGLDGSCVDGLTEHTRFDGLATGPDDRLVAVGEWGSVAVSDDGSSWTPTRNPRPYGVYGLAIGAGRVVAAGNGGLSLAGTPDELVVTEPLTHDDELIMRIEWDGSRFVAVEYLGGLLVSADGVTWDRWRIAGDPDELRDLAIADDRLAVIDGTGRVHVTRDDGATWQSGDSGLPGYGLLVWDGTRFVAVRGRQTVVSDDGVEWQPLASSLSCGISALAVGEAGVLALGTGCAGVLSPGASSWQAAAPAGDSYVNDVAWTGHRFVAVGRDGLVAISEDGTGWTRLPFRLDLDLRRVATDGDVILVAGDGASVLRRSLADLPAPSPDDLAVPLS